MQDIISTPLIFPRVEPSDWSKWWIIWNKNSKFLKKVVKNHNETGAKWMGMDIYIAPGVDSAISTGYNAPYVDCSELFKQTIDNIDQLPINVQVIRAASSVCEHSPHSDFSRPEFSVRSMLYDTNVRSTFYYQFNNKKVYQHLPADSNTWGYWDHASMHGTDYHSGHRKILLIYYGITKENINISDSVDRYVNYVIK
jgi:hypothetical protein